MASEEAVPRGVDERGRRGLVDEVDARAVLHEQTHDVRVAGPVVGGFWTKNLTFLLADCDPDCE